MSAPSVPAQRLRRSIACDECRRRKLRCDGQKPHCGICLETGIACELTQRRTRGPKKGHLRDLKNRLVQLEGLLDGRLPAQNIQHDFPSGDASGAGLNLTPALSPSSLSDFGQDGSGATETLTLPGVTTSSTLEHGPLLQLRSTPTVHSPCQPTSSQPTISTPGGSLPPMTRALQEELDQLYLDRAHPSIPVLHQRRYMTWSKSTARTESQRCLQYAMWAMASLLSTQFRDMLELLYQEAKRMLEHLTLDGEEDDTTSIGTELAQAWVLIAAFESMRAFHRRAWMSAGRAFRLVQALHYHEIDSPTRRQGLSPPLGRDSIAVEEKRRVFWMAYLLDHLISLRDDWPITLNEHVICTRLPAPDSDFQNGCQELGPLLSEAMTDASLRLRSPFNECLILATICGRSLLQSQQYQISTAYGGTPVDWVEQQRWINTLLLNRLQVLSQYYPAPTESNDPLLLFAHIVAQATVIYCCKTMTDLATLQESSERSSDYNHAHRALGASERIIHLAKTLPELPISKVHPLMPLPLFLCAEFLYDRMSTDPAVHLPIQELFDVFSRLRNVNDLEKSYLDLLPRSCLSKTAEMVGLCFDTSSSGPSS
ncbi:fungal-specific transcription factor domain-containing protein [Aspergillus pseudodeflectus]|uniref:Fungal-specific transcription factor domain-containing protein n=1 Tax=Aspergillus pseudodeflectus TaxID=176178 RepID=A0ABR4JWE8_9EURO